ncbi:MAG: insulinase family protein [Flavobacteriales bacterium]|nr:insulinase family protein [Flavobacteriales bacterium]
MQQAIDKNGNSYEFSQLDSSNVRIYTLKNGLKIFLAQNFDEPRIQTFIPVRSGSANDPKDNTGLAHYLEHMMFKGTSKIGTTNWEKEKPLINQITELFEQHKAENDLEKKREIYKQIDQLSYSASQYSIANEYDKFIASIGGKDTNAYTWYDETVYVNNIPSNELEKWLELESERFSNPVFRLFHTELETVYEEFNRYQDHDAHIVNNELMSILFQNHPYGTQTTLGNPEHLKNPSIKSIQKYFSTYYVPNNMAIVLVGDLQFEQTIESIKKHFDDFKNKSLPLKKQIKEKPIDGIKEKTVYSNSTEHFVIAFRNDNIDSNNVLKLELVDMILFNGTAGIMDLNIVKKQLATKVVSHVTTHKEYGFHRFYGIPNENQTLDELKELILEQIEKIKKGDFESWILEAVVNDLELHKIKELETSSGLANALTDSFILGKSWEEQVQEIEEMRKITKEELVEFANEFYKDNYAIVYKKNGKNTNQIKVESPEITPIEINRNENSDYFNEFKKTKSEEIMPVFLDVKNELDSGFLRNVMFYHVKNLYNERASINYIYRYGTDHDNRIKIAVEFLKYARTSKKDADEIAQEFYQLGIRVKYRVEHKKTVITLYGLSQNLAKGIELFEKLLVDLTVDEEQLQKYIQTILKNRKDAKINKRTISSALHQYALYGKDNRTRNAISNEELKSITSREIVAKIKQLQDYKHEIFYYGNEPLNLKNTILKYHNFGRSIPIPNPKEYVEQKGKDIIYVVDYDMVQAELSLYNQNKTFDKDLFKFSYLFNEYFGSGLSSIVFQEIREAKSLAYSAFYIFKLALEQNGFNYTYGKLGTQPDKLKIAVDTLTELTQNFPESEVLFKNAKKNVLKNIASERFTRENIFWSYDKLKARGIDYDIREEVYNQLNAMSLSDLSSFFNEFIQTDKYNYSIMSDIKSLDYKMLSELGSIEELSVDELFGY